MDKIISGSTGFVYLTGNNAFKYIKIREMYWLREYIALLKLWDKKHSNIIEFKSINFVHEAKPVIKSKGNLEEVNHSNNHVVNHSENNGVKLKKRVYLKIEFERYQNTLSTINILNDVGLIQILLDLFSAVSVCHSNNIWHRDIKTDNIIITEDERAMLIDFSHAYYNKYKSVILDEQVVTYPYRAPEIFTYQKQKEKERTHNYYNEKIDIWSLGVVLFELITNKSLYDLARYYITKEECSSTEEALSKFLQITQDEFIERLIKFISANTQPTPKIKYLPTYIKWIIALLQINPEKRPYAESFYLKIVNFIKKEKIKTDLDVAEVKVTNTTEANTTNVADVAEVKLYIPKYVNIKSPDVNNKIITYIDKKYNNIYNDIFNITVEYLYSTISKTYNMDKIANVLKYLICTEFITIKNYKNASKTVVLCIANIVDDLIIQINNIASTKSDELKIYNHLHVFLHEYSELLLNYNFNKE